ncbi:hypothetical protein ACVILJ_003658 [Bradyrhizobium diazoefficiens]
MGHDQVGDPLELSQRLHVIDQQGFAVEICTGDNDDRASLSTLRQRGNKLRRTVPLDLDENALGTIDDKSRQSVPHG